MHLRVAFVLSFAALALTACGKKSKPSAIVIDASQADLEPAFDAGPDGAVWHTGPNYKFQAPSGWRAELADHAFTLRRSASVGDGLVQVFLEPKVTMPAREFVDRVLAGLSQRYQGLEVLERSAVQPNTEAVFVSFTFESVNLVGIAVIGTEAGAGLAGIYAAAPDRFDQSLAPTLLRDIMTTVQ